MRYKRLLATCPAMMGLLLSACAAGGTQEPGAAAVAPDVAIEFVMAREGGLCVTRKGGALCRLSMVVRDDGTWEAAGTLPPAPAKGAVASGAATRLATIVEDEWEVLTARPFEGTCPSAYDGQELSYAVRRLPAGSEAQLADASVRELRACTYDLEHDEARAVLQRLQTSWRELGLPE